jgi:hypothetical protein
MMQIRPESQSGMGEFGTRIRDEKLRIRDPGLTQQSYGMT